MSSSSTPPPSLTSAEVRASLTQLASARENAVKCSQSASRSCSTLRSSMRALDAKMASARETVDCMFDADDDEDGQGALPADGPALMAAAVHPAAQLRSSPIAVPSLPVQHARPAIAMLIRDPPLAALHTFIRYHVRVLGFVHVYLYFDDIDDDGHDAATMATVRECYPATAVTATRCTAAWFDALEARCAPATWGRFGPYVRTDLIARQVLAVEQGLRAAHEAGLDWLLHIDVDELLHFPGLTAQSGVAGVASAWFAAVPQHVDAVRFLNAEAAPERLELLPAGGGDYFRELSLFKVNPSRLRPGALRKHWPRGRRHFTAYSNGKSAVRVGVSFEDVVPEGAHCYSRAGGKLTHTCSKEGSVGSGGGGDGCVSDGTPALLSVDAACIDEERGVVTQGVLSAPQVLHFPHCSLSLWKRKYAVLGRFPSVWFGERKIPEGSFHLCSRDAICGEEEKVAPSSSSSSSSSASSSSSTSSASSDSSLEQLFSAAVVFPDVETNDKLLRAGLLVRYGELAELIEHAHGLGVDD